jgi:hypothetical protein
MAAPVTIWGSRNSGLEPAWRPTKHRYLWAFRTIERKRRNRAYRSAWVSAARRASRPIVRPIRVSPIYRLCAQLNSYGFQGFQIARRWHLAGRRSICANNKALPMELIDGEVVEAFRDDLLNPWFSIAPYVTHELTE